jgi:hypothetical protein
MGAEDALTVSGESIQASASMSSHMSSKHGVNKKKKKAGELSWLELQIRINARDRKSFWNHTRFCCAIKNHRKTMILKREWFIGIW